jgi:DNA repair protein SbcD/Mre11
LWWLGALPQTLVWDRQAGLHASGGRPTDEFAAFCGQLKVDWHFCQPADPQAPRASASFWEARCPQARKLVRPDAERISESSSSRSIRVHVGRKRVRLESRSRGLLGRRPPGVELGHLDRAFCGVDLPGGVQWHHFSSASCSSCAVRSRARSSVTLGDAQRLTRGVELGGLVGSERFWSNGGRCGHIRTQDSSFELNTRSLSYAAVRLSDAATTQAQHMRILHLADVHLDRPFVGLPLEPARARRRELREAFDRCLALARERHADVVTIGGDLWEDEHVTPDTCRWVASRLEALDLPVVLVAGNHDPLREGGPYYRTPWPDNVVVLPAETVGEFTIGEVSIWGTSWTGHPLTADFLQTFRAPEDGRSHILLIHGTAGTFFEHGAHCPFNGEAVRTAGFDLCLAGHLHSAGERDGVWYPGSPEPLGWGESGRHAVALVDVRGARPPDVQLIDVNQRRYRQTTVACDGAGSSADVERILREVVDSAAAGQPEGLCLRAVLDGRVDPACEIDPSALTRAAGNALTLLDVRDETRPAFDLDHLAEQGTAVGVFVREMRRRLEICDEDERDRLELALELGLRAIQGESLSHAA